MKKEIEKLLEGYDYVIVTKKAITVQVSSNLALYKIAGVLIDALNHVNSNAVELVISKIGMKILKSVPSNIPLTSEAKKFTDDIDKKLSKIVEKSEKDVVVIYAGEKYGKMIINIYDVNKFLEKIDKLNAIYVKKGGN